MNRRTTIIFGISGWVKLVTLYCHTIFWGAEGLAKGCAKITLIVSCLEWLTCLFSFIMVEFGRFQNSRDLIMVLIILVTKDGSKRVQCSNEFILTLT